MPLASLRYAISGQRGLRSAAKPTAGVQVRYFSKADGNSYPLDGSTITATVDESAAEAEIGEGLTFTEMVKDFKIDVLDLPVFPQAEDTIIVVDGLGIPDQYYMVLDTGGSRASEPLGNFEDTWRIHTKNIPNPTVQQLQSIYGNAAGIAYGNQDPSGIAYGSSRR